MRALVLLVALVAASIAHAQAPSRDPRAILGRDLTVVSTGRRVVAMSGEEVRFDDGLVVHTFHGTQVVDMSLPVPAGTTCADVPRWLGLPEIPGSFPLRRGDGCEWPGRSSRHVLAEGLAARLRDGVLTIWRAP